MRRESSTPDGSDLDAIVAKLESQVQRMMQPTRVPERPSTGGCQRAPQPPVQSTSFRRPSTARTPVVREATPPAVVLRRAGGRTAGSRGAAMRFDGTGGCVHLPIISDIAQCCDSFALDMWVQVNPEQAEQRTMHILDTLVSGRRHTLQVGGGMLKLRALDARGVMSTLVAPAASLFNGEWHHLQVRWTPQPSARLDGRRLIHEPRVDDQVRAPGGGQLSQAAVLGCALPIRPSLAVVEPFAGIVAELRLWNCMDHPPRVAARFPFTEGFGAPRDVCRERAKKTAGGGATLWGVSPSSCSWLPTAPAWPSCALRLGGAAYLSAGTLGIGSRIPSLEIELWFATGSTAAQALLGVTDSQRRHQQLVITVHQGMTELNEPNAVRVALRDGVGRTRCAVAIPDPPPPQPAVTLADGHWHHLRIRTGGGEGGGVAVAVDGRWAEGSELQQQVGPGGDAVDFAPLLDFVGIGAHNDRGRVGTFFDGVLADITIRTTSSPAETLAHWPLDDGPGASVLTDHSGKQSHAVYRLARRVEPLEDPDSPFSGGGGPGTFSWDVATQQQQQLAAPPQPPQPLSPSRGNLESAVADRAAQEWIPVHRPPADPAAAGQPRKEDAPLEPHPRLLQKRLSAASPVSAPTCSPDIGPMVPSPLPRQSLRRMSQRRSLAGGEALLVGSLSGGRDRRASFTCDAAGNADAGGADPKLGGTASNPSTFVRRRRRTQEVAEVVQQATEALRQLVVMQGTQETVECVLGCLSEVCDPERLMDPLAAWLEKQRRRRAGVLAATGAPAAPRYGDGVHDAAAPAEVGLAEVYSPDYNPPGDVWHSLQAISDWAMPSGELWEAETVGDMIANCRFIGRRHACGQPAHVSAPLHCITGELCHRAVWAVWVPVAVPRGSSDGRWHVLRQWLPLEGAFAAADAGSAIPVPTPAAVELARLFGETGVIAGCDQLPAPSLTLPLSKSPGSVNSLSSPVSPTRQAAAQRRISAKVPNITFQQQHSLPSGLALFSSTPFGITAVRCVNAQRGSEAAPLSEAAAWLPPRDAAIAISGHFSVLSAGEAGQGLPDWRVLEYVHSRPGDERLSGPDWRVAPAADDEALQGLAAACRAELNQQRHSPELAAALQRLLRRGVAPSSEDGAPEGIAPVLLQRLVQHKLAAEERLGVGPAAKPVPAAVAHALCLQRLHYKGRRYVLAFTGPALAAFDGGDDGEPPVTHLWRLVNTCADQVLTHANAAVRSWQAARSSGSGGAPPAITVSVDAQVVVSAAPGGSGSAAAAVAAGAGGRYVGPDPEVWFSQAETEESPEPTFVRERAPHYTASWAEGRWEIQLQGRRGSTASPDSAYTPSEPDGTVCVDPDCVEFAAGSWLLPHARPLICAVSRALARVSARPGRVYRAAAAPLPQGVYFRGAVVSWAAFSLASRDQGCAAAAVTVAGGGAAVLCADCPRAPDTSRWSRFCRQADCVLPMASCWLVEGALSAEHQLLSGRVGKHYELRQVDDLEALEIFARQQVAVCSTSAPAVLPEDIDAEPAEHIEQLVGIAQRISAARRWRIEGEEAECIAQLSWALADVADAERPALYTPEGWQLARELLRQGADSARLDTALATAWTDRFVSPARKLDKVLCLVQCGADARTVQHIEFAFVVVGPADGTPGSQYPGDQGARRESGGLGASLRGELAAEGGTPLHLAVRICRGTFIRPLIDNFGLSPDARDGDGRTPLHWAARLGLLGITRTLVDCGADIDLRDNEGRTALHWAAAAPEFERSEEGIELLGSLASSRSLELRDNGGWTAFHVAVSKRNFAAADRIKALGADPGAKVGRYEMDPALLLMPPSQPLALTEATARPLAADAHHASWKRRLDSFVGGLPGGGNALSGGHLR